MICYNIVANMKGVMIMQDEARWEMIYNKINGFIEPDVCPWVRDESSMEGALGPLARQVYEARNRLCERMGVNPDTDPDFELLVSGFEEFSRACGELMYRYGCQDGIKAE